MLLTSTWCRVIVAGLHQSFDGIIVAQCAGLSVFFVLPSCCSVRQSGLRWADSESRALVSPFPSACSTHGNGAYVYSFLRPNRVEAGMTICRRL